MYDLQGAIRLVEDGQGPHVVNESKLALRDVGVLRRTNDGVELAWVGQLDPASTEPLRFRLSAKDKPRFDEWNRSLDMLSFEVEARQTMLQYDTDMDKMLDKFEAAKIDRLTEFFDQADGRLLAKSTADSAVDGKLSLGELEFCCLLARDGNVGLGRFLDLTLGRLRLGNGETRLIGWCDQDLGGMSIRPEVTQAHSQTFVIVHMRPANLPRAERDKNYIGNFVAGRPGLNVLPDN